MEGAADEGDTMYTHATASLTLIFGENEKVNVRRSSHCQVVNQFLFSRKSFRNVVANARRAPINLGHLKIFPLMDKNTYFQTHLIAPFLIFRF